MDQQSCVVKEGDQVKDQDEKDWRLSDEKEGGGGGGRGVYIVFYRSDWLWADRTPLPPTLDGEFDADPRALPYIGL